MNEHGGVGGGRGGVTHPASGVLARLTAAVQRLRAPDPAALIQLRDVLVDSDISPFEVRFCRSDHNIFHSLSNRFDYLRR